MRTCVEDLMELEAQRKDKVRQEEEEVTEEPKRFTTQEMARGFSFFFHKFIYFIYLSLSVLGLCCCVQAFSSCGERGLLFVVVCRLLIVVASLVAGHGL